MKIIIFLAAFAWINSYNVWAVWKVKEVILHGEREILSVSWEEKEISEEKIILKNHPYVLDEFSPSNQRNYQEVLYRKDRLPPEYAYSYTKMKRENIELPDSEVKTLIEQGSPDNRINLTILGDGYTIEEKEKFFSDAKRIGEIRAIPLKNTPLLSDRRKQGGVFLINQPPNMKIHI